MFVFTLSFVACATSTVVDTALTDTSDASETGDTAMLDRPAAGHKACGPTDAVVQDFLVGTDVCDGPPAGEFARLSPFALTFTAGDHFSIADGTMMAWWQTTPEDGASATTAELDVTAVGTTVDFTWGLVVDGVEHQGVAHATICTGDDPQCG